MLTACRKTAEVNHFLFQACIGAAFANTEIDVVLRTILTHFRIETDNAPDERVHHRGIAYTPGDGGRLVVYHRK